MDLFRAYEIATDPQESELERLSALREMVGILTAGEPHPDVLLAMQLYWDRKNEEIAADQLRARLGLPSR